MKTCVPGQGRVEIAETEKPSPGEGDVLIEMKACGICGTDVEKVLGHYPSRSFGHEAVGIIVEVGERVTAFDEGDRVFPHHHVPCYSCHYCKSGSETMCPHFSSSNLIPGGLSEYFLMPAWNIEHGGLFRLPNRLDFKRGTLIEPLACAIRGIRRLGLTQDSTVAVVGAGPVGMLHIFALHSNGFRVDAVEPDQARGAFAVKLGAESSYVPNEATESIKSKTEGRGADAVVVATGSVAAMKTGIALLRKGGTLLQFGLPMPGTLLDYDLNTLFRNEIKIVNTYSAVEREVAEAIEMLSSAEGVVDDIISHSFSLERAAEAFDLAMKQKGRKIIVER
ncbi:MAG: alcohol dehydrogenase catalytic domain-containing protein [Methanomassiliicoccales archaeon]